MVRDCWGCDVSDCWGCDVRDCRMCNVRDWRMTMEWEDFYDFYSTGLFLVGVVIRQHGIHVIGCLYAVVERVVATVSDALVSGRGPGDGLRGWNGNLGYFPCLLVL